MIGLKISRVFHLVLMLLSASLLSACVVLGELDRDVNYLLGVTQSETRRVQQVYDQTRVNLDQAALEGTISWVEAAMRMRDLDRSFAGTGSWVFDSFDEEFHAFCIMAAGYLDNRRITYDYYYAIRAAKFNEIKLRRR